MTDFLVAVSYRRIYKIQLHEEDNAGVRHSSGGNKDVPAGKGAAEAWRGV